MHKDLGHFIQFTLEFLSHLESLCLAQLGFHPIHSHRDTFVSVTPWQTFPVQLGQSCKYPLASSHLCTKPCFFSAAAACLLPLVEAEPFPS